MPCYSTPKVGQTEAQRKASVLAALKRLESALATGTAKVIIGPQGAVAFVGWTDRDDLTDVCAFRSLTTMKSHALSRAIAAAEVRAGRKVDARAVEAGWHTHDGGATWGRH